MEFGIIGITIGLSAEDRLIIEAMAEKQQPLTGAELLEKRAQLRTKLEGATDRSIHGGFMRRVLARCQVSYYEHQLEFLSPAESMIEVAIPDQRQAANS